MITMVNKSSQDMALSLKQHFQHFPSSFIASNMVCELGKHHGEGNAEYTVNQAFTDNTAADCGHWCLDCFIGTAFFSGGRTGFFSY